MPKHGIAKLLCNNKDANQQRDLDTEQMRNMVLQTLEQRKQRLYAQQESDLDDDEEYNCNSNHKKQQRRLEMEEAIQIAETIQGLAETLTALKDRNCRSVLTEEGGQHLEESLQDSLRKMTASLEGSAITENRAVKHSLLQATESLQKSRDELSFSQAFAAQGKTPRHSNLSQVPSQSRSLGEKTPRRSNLSNPHDKDYDEDDNNHPLKPISGLHNVRRTPPQQAIKEASQSKRNSNSATKSKGTKGTNGVPRSSSSKKQARGSPSYSESKSSSAKKDSKVPTTMQETAFVTATRMAGEGLQDALSKAIASLVITKDENNHVQVEPPIIHTIERTQQHRRSSSGRKSMSAADSSRSSHRSDDTSNNNAAKPRKSRTSMGPPTASYDAQSRASARSCTPHHAQGHEKDSRHLNVRFHNDFSDATDRRKKIQVKTGDVNIKISAPSVKGISLNTTQTENFRHCRSTSNGRESDGNNSSSKSHIFDDLQKQQLPGPIIKSPRKKSFAVLSPRTRDTSRGRLWSRMTTRGAKTVDSEEEQSEKQDRNHHKPKSVERWTLSKKNGDLVMSNQKDTIAKFEGATIKSINGYRPPGLTASSGSTSLSSMSSEDAITYSSWSSGMSHDENRSKMYTPPKSTHQPGPSSAQKKSATQRQSLPASGTPPLSRQQHSTSVVGTPPLGRLPEQRSLSVQTKTRQKPSMDPPMSALSHCSGFISQGDQDTGFPIKYRSVKSDEEKGFEIYLHEADGDDQCPPYRVMSDVTPSPFTSPVSAGSKASEKSIVSKFSPLSPKRYTSQELKMRAKAGVSMRRTNRNLSPSPYGEDLILLNRSASTNSRAISALLNLDSGDRSPSSFQSRSTPYPQTATRRKNDESSAALSRGGNYSHASSSREVIRE